MSFILFYVLYFDIEFEFLLGADVYKFFQSEFTAGYCQLL